MKDVRDKGEGQATTPANNPPGDSGQKTSKQDRLKLALRENLKRRKSQARGRSEIAPSLADDASPYRGGKKLGE
jgi:hypothetical protein